MKINSSLAVISVAMVALAAFVYISDRTDIHEDAKIANLQSSDSKQVLVINETESIQTEASEKEIMKAQFSTNKGSFELELFPDLAPKTVENFVTLAESDFYNGVKFHRVIAGFMVQAGDPLSKDEEMVDRWGTGGPGYTFEDEIHAENNNLIGTISMANAGPNTNGSQFFINTADNGFLDGKHTVFGKVVSGMDIVSMIESVDTFPNDRPIEHVIIESITIVK